MCVYSAVQCWQGARGLFTPWKHLFVDFLIPFCKKSSVTKRVHLLSMCEHVQATTKEKVKAMEEYEIIGCI